MIVSISLLKARENIMFKIPSPTLPKNLVAFEEQLVLTIRNVLEW